MRGLQTQTILQKLFLPTLAAPPATSAVSSGAKAEPASMASAGGAAAESLPAEHAEVRWSRADRGALPRRLHPLAPR
eukprot:COSAG01_NODE_20963_length_925_cov_1.296610_1_plen_76_part_10